MPFQPFVVFSALDEPFAQNPRTLVVYIGSAIDARILHEGGEKERAAGGLSSGLA